MRMRVLSILFGLPVLSGIIYAASDGFLLAFFAFMQFLLSLEIMRLLLSSDPWFSKTTANPKRWIGFYPHDWVMAAVSVSIFLLMAQGSQFRSFAFFAFPCLFTIAASALFPGTIPERSLRAKSMALGITYSVIPWVAIWDLSQLGPDRRHLVYLLAVCWSGDSAAFLFGKAWGVRKIAPRISPNKTWLGSVAGLLTSGVVAVLCAFFYQGSFLSWPLILLSGLAVAVAGQAGDLFKSIFKRERGVKDSGILIPGHGGLLDRMDGVLMAAPLLLILVF